MSSDSRTTIRRILIANRGEIARRVVRTARAMGIETVAVYSAGDADAPFVTEADAAVALGGRTASDSYLDGAKILDAARRTGADAVHPGYGFLSENAEFARAVQDAGLLWIGPPPTAIAAMGDKIAAKALMVDAGVPTLPSFTVEEGADLSSLAADIGFPVLVKASAGGGGKGMRVVEAASQLTDAIDGARREALNSFGDDAVFVEKYLPAPRHIEIQVLGDTFGTLVHCFERECSIQRRHQKIVEEAPSVALDDTTRDAMGAAAIAAVAAVGYHSAGTVEFLFDDETQEFFFLEVNTRLQVEHPVTEEITGLDLVRLQILVAQGHPLPFTQADLSRSGHAIEARLYAEDPANDFMPSVGTLEAFRFPTDLGLRLDSGVEQGSTVSVEFDPMLAKIISWAPTRAEAAARLTLALRDAQLAGVTTNRHSLVEILSHEAFLAGETRTDFVDRHAVTDRPQPTPEAVAEALVAAALYSQHRNHQAATALPFLRSGYRNSHMPPQQLRFDVPRPLSDAGPDPDTTAEGTAAATATANTTAENTATPGTTTAGTTAAVVSYESRRDGSFLCVVGEHQLVASVELCADGELVAVIDGIRRRYLIALQDQPQGRGRRWQIQGQGGPASGPVDLVEHPRFPDTVGGTVDGGQVAPMPGIVRSIPVEVGDEVGGGQTLLVMEAMKMEHTIVAPEPATVTEIRCGVGDRVETDAVLVVLEPLVP